MVVEGDEGDETALAGEATTSDRRLRKHTIIDRCCSLRLSSRSSLTFPCFHLRNELISGNLKIKTIMYSRGGLLLTE